MALNTSKLTPLPFKG